MNAGPEPKMGNALDYDAIANDVFAPLYPVVADLLLKRTGVS